MLKIRLQRIGRRNDPSFRVVVTDSRRGPKSTRYVELLGSHNPKMHATALKGERVTYWIGKGAQVSGTVHNMLVSEGLVTGRKINVLPKKRPIVKEKEEKSEEARPAEEANSVPTEAAPDSTDEEMKTKETQIVEDAEIKEVQADEAARSEDGGVEADVVEKEEPETGDAKTL